MRSDRATDLLNRLAELEQNLAGVRRELGEERVRADLPRVPFQAVCFLVGGDFYALCSDSVREVVRYAALTRIPGTARAIEGALNLRGEIILVLNVARRLGFGGVELDLKTPIIVVELHGRSVGLLVDRVVDVCTLTPSDLKRPSGSDAKYVAALGNVDGRLLQLIDLGTILSAADLEELEARLSEPPLLAEHAAAKTSTEQGSFE
jgi:purine-binding chemotaxis protein CheW